MSVTAPAGFRAAGVRAGLKASGRHDLALVVNDGPLDVAAGVLRIRTGAARRRLSVERGSLVDCPSVEDLPHLLLLTGTAS